MSKLSRLFNPPPPPPPPLPPAPPEDHLPELWISKLHLERLSRANVRAIPLPDGTILCQVLGRYIAYVSAIDLTHVPHLLMNGCWESWVSVAIHRLLKPGMYCVDGGANAGYFSLVMADAVGREGRVLAVEANPALAKLFEKTILVNGFSGCVTVRNNALSDTDDKTVNLFIPRELLGSATVRRPPTPDSVPVPVQTVTLDTALQDWPRVDLVKLDIEGSEYLAWRGLQKTIARCPDIVIVMEFVPVHFKDYVGEFLAEIVAAGFELRYIDVESELQRITVEQLLANPRELFMLCLRRPPPPPPPPPERPGAETKPG